MFILRKCSLIILLISIAATSPSAQTSSRALRVGAARVDITPPPDAALPMSGYESRKDGFHGIHDPIYVRAIVLDNGSTRAAILSWELIGMPNGVWQSLSERISRELGIPAENVILAGEHVHSAPSVAGMYGETSGNTFDFTKKAEELAFEALRKAQQNLEPARVAFETGTSDVNVNRRELFPDESWGLGYNPNGPSDKVVTVVKFESLSGKPIALFINYGVHGVVMGSENYQVSGDLPGATSRFIEEYYSGKIATRPDAGWDLALRPEEKNDGVVALWTSGPAGDQNPIALDSGEDFSMVDALGRILGEDAVRAANRMTRWSGEEAIRGSQKVVSCPGQKVAPGPRPRKNYEFQPAEPVNIRLSLLMLGNVALAGVSGEVLTAIYEHLRAESPFSTTIMVTHANGSSGYIPNDAAYDQESYEITTTHLKRGCAENAIVNGFLDMMGR